MQQTHMAHTADAAMLNKLSPFFTLLFSAIFLKEKVKPKQELQYAERLSAQCLLLSQRFQC
jgi:uncharacterized membrane protein